MRKSARASIFLHLLIILIAVSTVGCSPRLSPLYRDYLVSTSPTNDARIQERIETALVKAGWTVKEGVTPNVVATDSRTFRHWGLYTVEAELEVAPVGKEFVRVFIHPYRHFFTGGRQKIPYLKRGLSKSVLNDLHTAFAEEGLSFIGTAQSRDQAAKRERG